MAKEHFTLASKNLKKRGIRSWLTVLGIVMGIAAVVSLISLGDGLRTAITGQFGSLGSDKLLIQNSGSGFGPPGSTSVTKLTSHDVNVIQSVSGVENVVPRLIRVVRVEYNGVAQFKYSGSLPTDKQLTNLVYETMTIELQEGSLIEGGETGKIILGNDFSTDIDFGKAVKVGSKITIQGKEFKVKGIMKKSSSIINNGLVLIAEKDMKDILGIGDEIDTIAVQVKPGEDAEQVAIKIEDALRRDRNENPGEEDFSVQTPVQAISGVNTILGIINLIILGIAAISLVVGGIGIANTMYTSVLERKREIGIMKAIGAKNSDVLFIFLIEAGLLGLIGGVIGAGLGLGAAMLIAKVAQGFLGGVGFSVVVSWPLLFFAVGFAFLLGSGSGVMPALQASKLNPVDALRG